MCTMDKWLSAAAYLEDSVIQSLAARIWADRLLSTVSVCPIPCWAAYMLSSACLAMACGLGYISSQQAVAWCSAPFTA